MEIIKVLDDSILNLPNSKKDLTKKDLMCGVILDQSGRIALIKKDNVMGLLVVPKGTYDELNLEELAHGFEYVQSIGIVDELKNKNGVKVENEVFVGRVSDKNVFQSKNGDSVVFVSPEDALKILNDNEKGIDASSIDDKYDSIYNINRDKSILRYYFINYIY